MSDLPDKPILEETTLIVDCVWEYMILNQRRSQLISSDESEILQKSLIIEPDQQFKCEIRLTAPDSFYRISMAQFLSSSTNKDEDNSAWIVDLSLDFITDQNLIYNLQTFSFMNHEGAIMGYIRWIPKLVSNNEQDKDKIKIIDKFSPMTNLNPIPLTRKYFERVTNASSGNLSKTDEFVEDGLLMMQPR
ncbi:unnamed protein product [Rotaria magnacalcarata]|nr:unnamed protein product [Rotaria magnacalcarata]